MDDEENFDPYAGMPSDFYYSPGESSGWGTPDSGYWDPYADAGDFYSSDNNDYGNDVGSTWQALSDSGSWDNSPASFTYNGKTTNWFKNQPSYVPGYTQQVYDKYRPDFEGSYSYADQPSSGSSSSYSSPAAWGESRDQNPWDQSLSPGANAFLFNNQASYWTPGKSSGLGSAADQLFDKGESWTQKWTPTFDDYSGTGTLAVKAGKPWGSGYGSAAWQLGDQGGYAVWPKDDGRFLPKERTLPGALNQMASKREPWTAFGTSPSQSGITPSDPPPGDPASGWWNPYALAPDSFFSTGATGSSGQSNPASPSANSGATSGPDSGWWNPYAGAPDSFWTRGAPNGSGSNGGNSNGAGSGNWPSMGGGGSSAPGAGNAGSGSNPAGHPWGGGGSGGSGGGSWWHKPSGTGGSPSGGGWPTTGHHPVGGGTVGGEWGTSPWAHHPHTPHWPHQPPAGQPPDSGQMPSWPHHPHPVRRRHPWWR